MCGWRKEGFGNKECAKGVVDFYYYFAEKDFIDC
jgi:hypothetical protein